MTVSFDGPNRLVIADPGVTTLVVQEVYSSWKQWTLEGDNLKYPSAFGAIGGDPLPTGNLGRTFFLENGWKIRPQEANHTLTVVGNLFTRDGSDPFVATVGTFNVRINMQTSTLVEGFYLEDLITKLLRNKQVTDPSTGKLTVYDDDDATVLLEGDIYEDVAGTQTYRGQGVERRERLT